ncbi:GtrA family protein [Parasedimentitalea marina]
MISAAQAQFLRFATVGTVVAGLYVSIYLLFLALSLDQAWANFLAFLIAVSIQYVGQTWWTFRKPLGRPDQIVRFSCTIGLGYLVSAGITGALGPALGWPEAVSASVVAIVLPIQNYLIFRIWVFAEADEQRKGREMPHIYSNQFYDYIDAGARTSAQAMISVVQPWLNAKSVVDLGSGRGVWTDEWTKAGVLDVAAVDGDYVDRDRLAVPKDKFHAADLTKTVDLGRRFDLAQSLEVGEHLAENASKALVESLTRHADRVLFSAAVPGQGGEFHINEKPLSFWQDLFASHGYTPFDCVRPQLKGTAGVEPWYRYNTVLYANAAGRDGLPAEVIACEIPVGQKVPLAGSLGWRMRRGIVSLMPRGLVTKFAQVRAAYLTNRARKANG